MEFRIDEGPPVLVDSIAVRGVDSIVDARRLTGRLPLAEGKPFDRTGFDASADTVALALENRGYPFATVFRNYTVDRATRTAAVDYETVPGPRARVGDIVIGGNHAVGERIIRRSLAVRVGDWFSQDALYDSQRSLYQTDLFRYVSVGIAADSVVAGADSVVRVRVQVPVCFPTAMAPESAVAPVRAAWVAPVLSARARTDLGAARMRTSRRGSARATQRG